MSHVIAKSSNMLMKKLLINDQITACVEQNNVSWVLYGKFWIETIVYYLFKILISCNHLQSIFKFCALSN